MRIPGVLHAAITGLLSLTFVALSGTSGFAEKEDMTPQALRDASTHVVLGEVKAIYSRKTTEGDWRYTRYVAEVKVQKVEKGTGIAAGSLVYVRYWTRVWASRAPIPPTTAGHRDLPIEGQSLRMYLAQNANDGFTDANRDGGFNVIGANGFEVPLPPAPSGPALAGWVPAKGNLKIGTRLCEGTGEQKQPYGVVLRFVGQGRVIVRYAGDGMDGVEDSLELSAPIWTNLFVRRDDPTLK